MEFDNINWAYAESQVLERNPIRFKFINLNVDRAIAPESRATPPGTHGLLPQGDPL